MIQPSVKIEHNEQRVAAAIQTTAWERLKASGERARDDVRASFKKAGDPNPPHFPPRSPSGILSRAVGFFIGLLAPFGLKTLASYAVRRGGEIEANTLGGLSEIQAVQVRAAGEVISEIAGVNELGGLFRGRHYPARSFERPALEREAPRYADSFRGSIGE
jgi:hypothetical protein